jgi:hypothetical protein
VAAELEGSPRRFVRWIVPVHDREESTGVDEDRHQRSLASTAS